MLVAGGCIKSARALGRSSKSTVLYVSADIDEYTVCVYPVSAQRGAVYSSCLRGPKNSSQPAQLVRVERRRLPLCYTLPRPTDRVDETRTQHPRCCTHDRPTSVPYRLEARRRGQSARLHGPSTQRHVPSEGSAERRIPRAKDPHTRSLNSEQKRKQSAAKTRVPTTNDTCKRSLVPTKKQSTNSSVVRLPQQTPGAVPLDRAEDARRTLFVFQHACCDQHMAFAADAPVRYRTTKCRLTQLCLLVVKGIPGGASFRPLPSFAKMRSPRCGTKPFPQLFWCARTVGSTGCGFIFLNSYPSLQLYPISPSFGSYVYSNMIILSPIDFLGGLGRLSLGHLFRAALLRGLCRRLLIVVPEQVIVVVIVRCRRHRRSGCRLEIHESIRRLRSSYCAHPD